MATLKGGEIYYRLVGNQTVLYEITQIRKLASSSSFCHDGSRLGRLVTLNYSDCHAPAEIIEVCFFGNVMDRCFVNLVVIPQNVENKY